MTKIVNFSQNYDKLSELSRSAEDLCKDVFIALWEICSNEISSEKDVTEDHKVYKFTDSEGYRCLTMQFRETTGADDINTPKKPVIEQKGQWVKLRGFETGSEYLITLQYLFDMYYEMSLEIERRLGVEDD